MMNLVTLRKWFVLSVLASIMLTSANAQPWTYDFGTAEATLNSNGQSITFFTGLPSGGGTYKVRSGTGGGTIALVNPGTSLGSGSELQIQMSTTLSTNKFGVYDWTTPSTVAYVKCGVRTNSFTNGNLNFSFGLNTVGSDNQAYTAQYNASIASLTITYSLGAISSIVRRIDGSNTTITGSGLVQNSDQAIEVYASNSAGSEVYHRAGTDYTLNPQSWDLWVDGTKISPALGWPKAGNWASGNNISGFGFFAQSSTLNLPGFYLDDLEYSNAFPVGPPNTSVQFVSTSSSIGEGAGTTNLALAITNPSISNSTTVNIGVSGATGRITGHSTSVTFPANTSGNQNCVVTLDDNLVCDGSQNVVFTITGITGGDGTPAIGGNSVHTLTVTDNESTSAPTATAATGESYDEFNANWSSVSGATGYFLDVSTYSDFLDPATTTVVEWNFPAATNDNIADGGIAANAAKTLTGVGPANVTYNSAGNGGLTARADTWGSGSGTKHWQVDLVTTGYGDLTVSSKQRSSGTGPRDFKVQYRIGVGGAWTDVPGSSITVADNYTSGALSNVALPAVCADQAQVFLRWIMTSDVSVNAGTIGAGGASNIDDVVIRGRANSFVSIYDDLSVGNVTTWNVATGLTPVTTYYYRVRSAGGCSNGANSNTISATTIAVPTYYSRANGDVNDPIWSDTPSGTAGPAVWTNASDMVVQNGHAVTIDANTTIKSLTVETGATLYIDANRWIKATAGTNTINGTLNAADNSEFQITEGTSATLALGGTVSFWDFTMGMTTGITVTGTMEVRGTLQLNDGDFNCTAALVTLNSTATETGSLGPVGATASYTGNMRIERYRPAGLTNWMLLGSPIQNRTVNNWQDDFITAGYPGSQYPNFPGGSQPNWPSIRWYDELNTGADSNDGLQGVSSNTQPLTTGQGFAVWAGSGLVNTTAFEVDLEAEAPVIASTPISLPVTFTGTGNPSADGWNLVSNPVPSPIDFELMTLGTSMVEAMTFYNPANGNTAAYNRVSNVGTNSATSVIQSMQGFFLQATNDIDVSASVHESHKVSGNTGGMFGTGEQVMPALRLSIASGINTFSDETVVVFEGGTPALDDNDILKFVLAHNAAPQIATLAPNGSMIAINAYGTMANGITIPVSVNAGVTGEYTITVSEQGELGLTCITLEDLATGAITPMSNGATYTFQLDAADDETVARFLIHATAPALLYAEDATCGGQANGQATIVAQGGPHDITWRNIAGEVLLVQTGISSGVATITGLEAGGYSVSVTTETCGTLSRDFSISAPFVLEGQAFATNATCADALDGTIDLMPLGGTAPYAFLWNDDAASTSEDLIAAPGNYAVTITDANGCAWTSDEVAIGHEGPVATMLNTPVTALVNDPVQFTAADADAAYFWSFGDGATSDVQNPVHAFELPGTYTVVLFIDNGLCTDATSSEIIIELSTSITEVAPMQHRAWATPQGIVVEHAFQSNDAVNVDLLDATGRLVIARRMSAQRMVLPAEGLSSGLWFVRLSNGSSQATLRVPLTR